MPLVDSRNRGEKMKQRESKDVTQKNLEGYPDVAADILNVFIHGGTQEVQPELCKCQIPRLAVS